MRASFTRLAIYLRLSGASRSCNTHFRRFTSNPIIMSENIEQSKPVGVPQKEETQLPKLPKLTPSEFRAYNRMAEHMNYFHNQFRQTWTLMYKACESNSRPSGMSIRQFLRTALDFCSHLDTHHSIEEAHIFPVLAKKMPRFREELDLLTQHHEIMEGVGKFQEYCAECSSGERELRLRELKVIMDGFGTVLWTHLDEEVKELGAENMRKFWSLEEMRRMPM